MEDAEEDTDPEEQPEETTEEPTVETTQEDDEPENLLELETTQDEPEDNEDNEDEVDPAEEPQDMNEAPEASFDTPRCSKHATSPPETLNMSNKGQSHDSLRSHSFAMAVEHCLVQTVKDKNAHSVEKGIEVHEDRGRESAMKEMKQTHCGQTFVPVASG